MPSFRHDIAQDRPPGKHELDWASSSVVGKRTQPTANDDGLQRPAWILDSIQRLPGPCIEAWNHAYIHHSGDGQFDCSLRRPTIIGGKEEERTNERRTEVEDGETQLSYVAFTAIGPARQMPSLEERESSVSPYGDRDGWSLRRATVHLLLAIPEVSVPP